MKLSILLALVAVAPPGLARAVVFCPDQTPAAITAAGKAGAKCQATIGREATKYVAAKLQILAACKIAAAAGACPTAADTNQLQLGAIKARDKIAKGCSSSAARAALGSSYKTVADPAVIASCTLSQQSVAGDLAAAEMHGATTEAWPETGAERVACLAEMSKASAAAAGLLKNANACLNAQTKKGTAGDLAPICVGRLQSGAFVAPTDKKTAGKQRKLIDKVGAKLAKKCGPADGLGQVPTIFGCAGAQNAAELQACAACTAQTALIDAIGSQYGEQGAYVANGAGALQAAVDAAAVGAKLLLGSGDYQEEVVVATNGLRIVGCGAATNDRPRLIPPTTETRGRGIQSNNVDGLLFQSLLTFGQSSDGIFVSGAQGVVFRDIVGDGNHVSRYAVFPVRSNGVLIELSTVRRVADAGVYVGQSSNIVVRHNDVRQSVAGSELENCANGRGYNNYATDNTAAFLVFKDPGLPTQLSQCHELDHNVFEANNRVNVGTGTVGMVPEGTGFLVIANDTTPFHHNIARNHDTFGFALVNQLLSGFGEPFSTDPEPDQNFVFANQLLTNGLDPDPRAQGFSGDAMSLNGGTGNCQAGNLFSAAPLFFVLPACALPVPAFPGCPAGPVLPPA